MFKENTKKPRKSCYIMNEKSQIGSYHKGFVYFYAQIPETKEIQNFCRPLECWCERWVDLKDCVDEEKLRKAGNIKKKRPKTWK